VKIRLIIVPRAIVLLGIVQLGVALLALACPADAQDSALEKSGLETWRKIHDVLSHSRCSNCHVGSDNRPMWSEPGNVSPGNVSPRPHGMNINAGESRIGAEALPCGTCHGKANAKIPHGPPGAENWRLPPADMQWFGKTSAEICLQIRDLKLNGGRSIEAIALHISDDKLVHWGWAPGPGRAPAPYSPEQLASFFRQWQAEGAPCPKE
jgi:hypothetical protein